MRLAQYGNPQNSMKQLYVYDFDKTIVPYDSYNRYLRHLFLLRPITMGILLVLRKMRILSSRVLKQDVTAIVEHSRLLQKDARHFASRLMYDITLLHHNEKDIQIVLLSASPKVYLKYVAEMLQCQLICSDTIDGTYVEMYGEIKKQYLHQRFPRDKYQYTYALSDSQSDMCWMQEFAHYEILGEEK